VDEVPTANGRQNPLDLARFGTDRNARALVAWLRYSPFALSVTAAFLLAIW
jgi:hypothetical protein